MKPACFCGCARQVTARHHVITKQALKRAAGRNWEHKVGWLGDERNLVPVALGCHAAHHDRSSPYRLRRLPDSVFEFAEEALGAGLAYETLRRYYEGQDPRLEALKERA